MRSVEGIAEIDDMPLFRRFDGRETLAFRFRRLHPVRTGSSDPGVLSVGAARCVGWTKEGRRHCGAHAIPSLILGNAQILFSENQIGASLFKWSRSKLLMNARAITRTGSATNLRFFQPLLPQHRLVTIFATSPQVRQCRDKSRYKSSCPTPAGRHGPRA